MHNSVNAPNPTELDNMNTVKMVNVICIFTTVKTKNPLEHWKARMGATDAPENVRSFWMIGSRWNWTDGETERKKLHLAIQVYLGNIVRSVPGLHREGSPGIPQV